MRKLCEYIKTRAERWIKIKTSQFGLENVKRLQEISDELDEYQKQYRRNHGIFRWLLWLAALTAFAAFSFWGGKTGIIAGVLALIAVIIAGKAGRRAYCMIAVHPRGIHGFNIGQAYLGRYTQNGPEFNKVARSYWMRKWYYFLYAKNGERWSWRPYAMICSLVLLLYWLPLIGVACLFVGLAAVFAVYVDIGFPPMALYLGSSSESSHRLLKKIMAVSGVRWASLLKHDIPMPDGDTSGYTTADDLMNGMELKFRTNPWSLRCDENSDWWSVVRDFILASCIIVVRPEISGPVQQEMDFLATLEYLNRVIVIQTDRQVKKQLPPPLQKYMMDEDEALDLIALTASQPRLFRKRIWGRGEVRGRVGDLK